MDFEIGVVAVRFTGEERGHLVLVRPFGKRGEAGQPLVHHVLVAFRLGHLDQLDRVGHFLIDRARGGNGGVQPRALAHHFLCLLLVVPQRRVLDARIQLVEPAQGAVPVQEAAQKVERGLDMVDMGLGFGAHGSISVYQSCGPL